MKHFKLLAVLLVFLLGAWPLAVDAREFEVKQRLVVFPPGSLNAIVGTQAFDPQRLRSIAENLFAQPVEDIMQKIGRAGVWPEVGENVFYFSGKKIRVDSTDANGKMSGIMRLDQRKIYSIMWAEKQYTEISMESMKQMQKQAGDAMKNMPPMEEALEQMPPEVRAQMQARAGASPAQQQEVKVTKTNRTATINGFPCDEYRAEMAAAAAQLYVSNKYPEVRQAFDIMMKEFGGFQELAGESGMQQVFNKIPNGLPVIVKQFELDPFSTEPTYHVTEIVSVTERKLPPDVFEPPAGFSRVALPAHPGAGY
ncbi:MAG: DUF4412 domain-containing protein [Desulforhabdus sp.]|jgi:hypothetical protein|nr:DUF4412 domain-containing protein [Desulforhabdus sp.]